MNSTALFRSAYATIWLIVGMTLLTEVSPPFKALLIQLAGQHWVAKSIITAIAFVVFYFLFRKSRESGKVFGGALMVLLNVVLGGSAIFGFFVWHFLTK
ncbi:MAG: hypothetical protein AAB964_02545 [Patescibacteria group bacterium]